MPELKIFSLKLKNKNYELTSTQHYPSFFTNQEIITELNTITQHFYKNGFGTIQTGDSIYYYETIKPQNNNIEIFALFLCEPHYKNTVINELMNKLNDLLNDSDVDENQLKNGLKDKLDELYLKYQFDEKSGAKKINWDHSINSNLEDDEANNEEGDAMASSSKDSSYSYKFKNRSDSQMFSVKDALKNFSMDETEFSFNYKKNLNTAPSEKMMLWRNLKKKYLLGSLILGGVIYFLVPLLLVIIRRSSI